MKKFVCKCGIWLAVFALTAGFFYFLWSTKSKNMSDAGILVKNMGGDLCDKIKNAFDISAPAKLSEYRNGCV